MDTRTKLLTPDEALAIAPGLGRLTVVTGYFDVLQPELIRRLQQIAGDGSKLLAIVVDPPAPLLAAHARAELAASLRVIDYVIRLDGDPSDLIDRLQAGTCIREEKAHLDSTERLIGHVFERHGRALAGRSHH